MKNILHITLFAMSLLQISCRQASSPTANGDTETTAITASQNSSAVTDSMNLTRAANGTVLGDSTLQNGRAQVSSESLAGNPEAAARAATRGRLDALFDMDGKMPDQVQLFEQPLLQKRLKALLSDTLYDKLLQLTSSPLPIQVKRDNFFVSGEKKGDGIANAAAIAINKNTNNLSVILLQQGKPTLFAEDKTVPSPDVLNNWAHSKRVQRLRTSRELETTTKENAIKQATKQRQIEQAQRAAAAAREAENKEHQRQLKIEEEKRRKEALQQK